jgi:hypothetical protein
MEMMLWNVWREREGLGFLAVIAVDEGRRCRHSVMIVPGAGQQGATDVSDATALPQADFQLVTLVIDVVAKLVLR